MWKINEIHRFAISILWQTGTKQSTIYLRRLALPTPCGKLESKWFSSRPFVNLIQVLFQFLSSYFVELQNTTVLYARNWKTKPIPFFILKACCCQISSNCWEHWVLEEYRILTISTTKCELLSALWANPAKVCKSNSAGQRFWRAPHPVWK